MPTTHHRDTHVRYSLTYSYAFLEHKYKWAVSSHPEINTPFSMIFTVGRLHRKLQLTNSTELVLLEKPTVAQLLENFPKCYGT
jgi:hypothetical protein